MKYYALLLGVFILNTSSAQELASDYIVPSVRSNKKFYKTVDYTLKGDLAEQSLSTVSKNFSVNTVSNSDGSVGYKLISFNSYDYLEEFGHFVKFSGNSASLYGFSEYETELDYLYLDIIVNEKYKELTPSVYYKIPNESYQTLDWTFVNPKSNVNVSASSYYKNMTVAGNERRILVIEFNENGKIKKEYYLKHFGLIAFTEPGGSNYVVDFKNFNLYSKSFIDSKSESELRGLAWNLIERLRKVESTDSFLKYNNFDRKQMYQKLDSLDGLMENMCLKTPSMMNVYKYMMSAYTKSALSKLFDKAEEKNAIYDQYFSLMELLNNYYLYRPTTEYIPKGSLNTYVSKVDQNYYENYWKVDYAYFKTVYANSDFDKSYRAFLMKPRVDNILLNETKLDNVNKCILYSYIAVYYDIMNDNSKRYHYLVVSVENYKYLSQKEKDLNIDYMRNVMVNLSTLIPGDESDLIRAINATLDLKDYNNSVKIAKNGYQNGIGKSIDFAFKYAEASYNDDLNKEQLRVAMKMLDGKHELMSSVQLTDYVKYCKAMSPEFDCSKAESMQSKALKKEKSIQSKKAKDDKKNNYRSGGSRALNLAINANPFAGLNISGNGGVFKFLPISASLRIKKVVHEFRYNPFLGFDAKNRFVGGKIIEDGGTNNAGWKNINGADYGYSMIFVKNDMSSYRKNCSSIGGGLNFIYGEFTADPEAISARIDGINRNLLINPAIKRYEGLLVFNYTFFDWKTHLSATMYYGVGAGIREITYGDAFFSEEILKNKERTVFTERRFIQDNWSGAYFTFRAGFRFGITLF